MKRYKVRIPPHLVTFLGHLHPLIKSKIRRALGELEYNPLLGKPLREELQGLYSLRVSQYRIVYQIRKAQILVEVIEIAQRKIVYQRVAEILRKLQ